MKAQFVPLKREKSSGVPSSLLVSNFCRFGKKWEWKGDKKFGEEHIDEYLFGEEKNRVRMKPQMDTLE